MSERDELVDEFLRASRALVGLSVQSVAASPVDVTMLQHRVLVTLASGGEQAVGDIAAELGVNPSNASRHCDRLQRLGLVERHRSASDGRVVHIALTPAGRSVLEAVASRRRQEVQRVLLTMRLDDVEAVVAGLRAFSDAAHETAERDWLDGPG